MNQNRADTVAYVETAKASHTSGLRKFGHIFIVSGYGNSQYASHGRPMWISGKIPAQATANKVMASANRLIEVRHCCRRSNRIAEISVPACPIPIHQTKLMIAKPHPTGNLNAPDPHAHHEKIRHGIHQHHHEQKRHGKSQHPPLGRFAAQHDVADLVRDGADTRIRARGSARSPFAPRVCQTGYLP